MSSNSNVINDVIQCFIFSYLGHIRRMIRDINLETELLRQDLKCTHFLILNINHYLESTVIKL